MSIASTVCVCLVVIVLGACYCYAIHKGVKSSMKSSLGDFHLEFTTSHACENVKQHQDTSSRLP
ncbi:hypothetical protein PPSQR21_032530 [Paenibacillus polymyxa SQR-21]|nr:hypothetical protein PPSQR21_032530 [Paenibacillus polymyxa SQR-21]